MKTAFKNIIPYFLLIAGAIIFFHSIVPHDHHYPVEGALQASHHQHPDNSPVHCHFLNDLITDYTNPGLNNHVVKQISAFTQFLTEPSPVLSYPVLNLTLKKEHAFYSTLAILSISPTRGSPEKII